MKNTDNAIKYLTDKFNRRKAVKYFGQRLLIREVNIYDAGYMNMRVHRDFTVAKYEFILDNGSTIIIERQPTRSIKNEQKSEITFS